MLSCEKCGKRYTNVYSNWCKPCQIDNLKGNFTNWTSGNEKIDNFIQEMQLKIDSRRDIVFTISLVILKNQTYKSMLYKVFE